MIRSYFSHIRKPKNDRITWRSHEPARIEAFSDSIFGFAISILIFSLDVPKRSDLLLESLKGLAPFAICFTFIFAIWYRQYLFFRRYGMHDKITVVLNGILIFVVLGYIYPLKFYLNAFLLKGVYTLLPQDHPILLLFYVGGIGLITLLFSLMYYNAFLKKDVLKLTEMEVFETRSYFTDRFYAVLFLIVVEIVVFCERNTLGDVKWTYYLLLLLPIQLVRRYVVHRRKQEFKRRFGDVPMKEPHHGSDG